MSRIDEAAHSVQSKSSHVLDTVKSLSDGFYSATSQFEAIEKSIDHLQHVSEEILMTTVAADVKTPHSEFVMETMRIASRISKTLYAAAREGRIDFVELFDKNYCPIDGSSPPQFETAYCSLFDRLLQPLFDQALNFDSRVVFCTAVDENGFLPTHNSKFSKQQGSDPVWNAANCRNSTFFPGPRWTCRGKKHKALSPSNLQPRHGRRSFCADGRCVGSHHDRWAALGRGSARLCLVGRPRRSAFSAPEGRISSKVV